MVSNNKRKIILINKNFQIKLIFKFIAVNILILLIFGIFMYLFTDSEIDKNLFTAHVTYKNMKQMILPIIVTLSTINIVVSSIIIYIFVLYASHRIAGPMYRFNAILDAISAKNLTGPTRLREGDQFIELSDSMHRLVTGLADDIKSIRSELDRAGEDAESLKKSMEKINEVVGKYSI
ncbi:MAG: hypothetical protein CVV44_12750 [Spirochaetae bacterium HGW-Spirochaetae-1]|nr:MAG: hypothetical protein CVV44_12750 [Spirochaetae bacterium HGW-Spirochaetae-1]